MGPLEIIIVLAIALVVFGGYFRKRLPEFGRKAGEQTRIGAGKAKELADQAGTKGSEVGGKVSEKVGDRFDPGTMGRNAGKHVRDAREFRDSFRDLNPMKEPQAKPAPPAAAPVAAAEPRPTSASPAEGSADLEGTAAPAPAEGPETGGEAEAETSPAPEPDPVPEPEEPRRS